VNEIQKVAVEFIHEIENLMRGPGGDALQDSLVAEAIWDTLGVYFVWGIHLSRRPTCYGAESGRIDRAVARAVDSFLDVAPDAADRLGLSPGHPRLDFLLNSLDGEATLGSLIGEPSGLVPPEPPLPWRFGSSDVGILNGERWEVPPPPYVRGSERPPTGCWGPGPLQNDDATAFLEALVIGESSLDMALAAHPNLAFREALVREKVTLAAACMVVLHVRGGSGERDAVDLARSLGGAMALQGEAREAVERIAASSALRDAWEGCGLGESWLRETRDLVTRLGPSQLCR
jgi:hypothetical protein